MHTDDDLEAWLKQPMYDEAFAKAMALKCTQWALYALGAELSPFSSEPEKDIQFDVAKQVLLGNEARALDSYARGYLENWELDLRLEKPTPKTLARWLHEEQCPDAELAMSEERLQKLFQAQARWFSLGDAGSALMGVLKGSTEKFSVAKLADVFRLWHKATEEFQSSTGHPLAPLMKAWFASRPRPADTSKRERERIIPARVAMAPPGDRRAGKLFSMAAHVVDGQNGQLVMPGFLVGRQAPALPLALYDLGLGTLKHQARNPAAPLALRLWVASILLTRQSDRHGNHPIALEIPLRKLLAELYPGRKPRPHEYWPRLMKAAETLGSPEARVPWYDHELGRGGQRHVVLVGDIPRGPGALDDRVQLIVNLPPGSDNGPQVSDNLALWGVKSDRAYRALLNLAYWWHDPGVTTRPLGQRADGQGRFWAQSQNSEHYPEMTDDQLVQIVFPTSAKKNFRHLVRGAQKVLLELQEAGEIDIIDGKPVPLLKLPPTTTEQG